MVADIYELVDLYKNLSHIWFFKYINTKFSKCDIFIIALFFVKIFQYHFIFHVVVATFLTFKYGKRNSQYVENSNKKVTYFSENVIFVSFLCPSKVKSWQYLPNTQPIPKSKKFSVYSYLKAFQRKIYHFIKHKAWDFFIIALFVIHFLTFVFRETGLSFVIIYSSEYY